MSPRGSLVTALGANATFSSATGITVIASPDTVRRSLGLDIDVPLRFLGIGLVVFAAAVFVQALRPIAARRVLVISVLDLGWVLASAAVVTVAPDHLSGRGVLTVVAVAGVVLLFGVWQLRALARTFERDDRPGVYHVRVNVASTADPDAMWAIIADLAAVHQHVPGLRSSRVEGDMDPGIGTQRTCETHAGSRWREEVTRWDPARREVEFRFLISPAYSPFPFVDLEGGWAVADAAAGCTVSIWWNAVPRRRWLAGALFPLMEHTVRRDMSRAVSSMESAARSTAAHAVS